MNIYLVGGAVRDSLLNYPFTEKDWVVVGATSDDLITQGYTPVGKDFPVFLHPQTKEEYALARTEKKSSPGYTGFDCYTSPDVTLEEDLLRRDLTINAMAQDTEGRIIDPYGGQQDLQDRVLRHVSPAFVEDPLRVLRVARLQARYAHLGFSIAKETMALMEQISLSGELQTLPAERIWRECEKALQEQAPADFFQTLKNCRALQVIMPALNKQSDSTYQLANSAAKHSSILTLRFAVLFSDIALPQTQQLCESIKAPNPYKELACMVSEHAKLTSQMSPNAETLLQLLEKLDAFRRFERFEHFLICCKLLYPSSQRWQLLTEAAEQCLAVDTKAIAKSGINGKAIGEKIRQQRLETLSALVN